MSLSCEIAEKVVLSPRFVREGIPQISVIHFQIALTSEHVVGFWPSSVKRDREGVADEKKKIEESM